MVQTKEDRAIVRSLATRNVLQKTDRLLGWDGRVRILPPQQDAGEDTFPAWTDGETITLNGTQHHLYEIFHAGFDRDAMLWVTGLNYHELAHCLFMPRLDSDLVRRVRDAGRFMAFNVLQDQADESKFVRLYGPARHYFTSAITKMMAGRSDLVRLNYPVISGRRFLPSDLRSLFRDNFALPEYLDQIDEITTEYVDLVFPEEEQRMETLITRMQDILDELRNQVGEPGLSSHHGDEDNNDPDNPDQGCTEGTPMPPDEQREIVGRGQVVSIDQGGTCGGLGDDPTTEGQPQSAQGPSEPSEDDDEASDQADDGQGSQEGTQSQDDPSEEDDESGESTGSPDREVDGLPGGQGAGQFKGVAKKWQPEVLDDLLDQIEQIASHELADELDSRQHSVRASEGEYQVTGTEMRFEERAPVEEKHASQAVEKELRRLNQRFKPGWHTRRETGKVDTNQIANIKRGRTDVFKQFSPGVNNAVEAEVVILLDQSGSMYRYSREAGSAMWVLHRAMKRIGAEITVLGYSDAYQCSVLLQRGVETPPRVRDYYSGGATFVMPALAETRRIFRVSNKPLKLVVIVTDGMFSDSQEVAVTLREMREPTAIVGINQNVAKSWDPDKHHALRVSKTIEHPKELVDFTKRLVMSLARERYTVTR